MTRVHAKLIGKEALLPWIELNQLLRLARQIEEVELKVYQDDIPTQGIMQLAERGGAFDWLADEEDLYTVDDLKVRYR